MIVYMYSALPDVFPEQSLQLQAFDSINCLFPTIRQCRNSLPSPAGGETRSIAGFGAHPHLLSTLILPFLILFLEVRIHIINAYNYLSFCAA